MRKDMLLKDWSRKARYADECKIKVGFMLSPDDDSWVLECFADLYIGGEIEETETIDLLESVDEIEKIPANMKRKAKAFFEYFKACNVFENSIEFNQELIRV